VTLRVAITGAGGFLGAALARRLLAEGADVLALSRRAPDIHGVRWQYYELAKPPNPPAALAGIDVVVHAAFAMGGAGYALEELNCSAARSLHVAARSLGAHFIFISSMSSHKEAVSSYGRAKWRIEAGLDAGVDAIVRPGLVIGPGGSYARMFSVLRRAPVLPLFYGGLQPLQPVGIEDLTEGLSRLVLRRMPGVYNIGIPVPITIREFYGRMLAAAGLHRLLVPFPGDAAVSVLRVCEAAGLHLPVTAENILGLKFLRSFETVDSLERLNLILAPLDKLAWASPSSKI